MWFAISHEIHPHYRAAREWAVSLSNDSVVYFCRFTQLGLLRLLTNQSAMGRDVLTQLQAWEAFDALVANPGNRMTEEPIGLDSQFRHQTSSREFATKQWSDGYLAAFSEVAGIQLVTFDRALAAKVSGAVLLS